jgi:hypothetical protein
MARQTLLPLMFGCAGLELPGSVERAAFAEGLRRSRERWNGSPANIGERSFEESTPRCQPNFSCSAKNLRDVL